LLTQSARRGGRRLTTKRRLSFLEPRRHDGTNRDISRDRARARLLISLPFARLLRPRFCHWSFQTPRHIFGATMSSTAFVTTESGTEHRAPGVDSAKLASNMLAILDAYGKQETLRAKEDSWQSAPLTHWIRNPQFGFAESRKAFLTLFGKHTFRGDPGYTRATFELVLGGLTFGWHPSWLSDDLMKPTQSALDQGQRVCWLGVEPSLVGTITDKPMPAPSSHSIKFVSQDEICETQLSHALCQ
jgi:hypothetical protein